ncbi:uncharacterized protein LOC116294161 [Actinia tenebrosa]|uniref:Uncharacterized protein LOC116294161 n=1 Tax=Actinia tenebrosa TaxID=6105 RepID=A0A6P8HY16_ACTTE|nr:uncharacterized protein LOC116294161 [Actinia tenebrosa]
MPRKQTKQHSRKRLWFNVVEFDKETGRPLWRNKKPKLENALPPCITDPKFTALVEKLRKETAESVRNNESTSWSPYSPTWTLHKYSLNPRGSSEVEKTSTSSLQSNSFEKVGYEEEGSPKLVMQFQHFSPLAWSESIDKSEQQKRHIQDLLKMKSGQAPFQPSHDDQNHMTRGNAIKRDVTGLCGITSNCAMPSEWRMDNTVRLHHIDLESSPNYGLTVNQQVPLTIY